MITSPCKTCVNLNKPKDVCSINCEKIKMIQNFQLARVAGPYTAVDDADSGRYKLCLPVTRFAEA